MKNQEEYMNVLGLIHMFHKQNLKIFGKYQINDKYLFLNIILNNPVFKYNIE